MFQEKTVKELTEDLLADIQQKVGFKVNMNMLMWRLYAQAKHIVENSDKKYHDLAVLYHIADSDNQEYLRANTEIDFDVTSYDFLVSSIQLGYNLPVIIHGQDMSDIMTYLVYVHARNIGYDHFVPGDENNQEEIDKVFAEVEVKPVSARRITDGMRRREVMMQKESTARQLKEKQLSNADIAELMDINEVSVRALLDPFDVDRTERRRTTSDAKRELMTQKESTARKLKAMKLSNADIAEYMDISESSVRSLLGPFDNDAKRKKELIEKVQWYTLYGLGAVLLLSIGLIIYTYIFNR